MEVWVDDGRRKDVRGLLAVTVDQGGDVDLAVGGVDDRGGGFDDGVGVSWGVVVDPGVDREA